ncbi:MAG: sigma 54-interacting transcriptional regulator [Candidatus Heteroscillospira sp.]
MGKTVMMLSQKSMVEAAGRVVAANPGIVDRICYLDPGTDTMETVQAAVRDGADLIIARGLQALDIEAGCDVPVVTIRLTGQEIAVMVHEIKKQCAVPCPRIALLGAVNMFPDLSAFNELFDVDLHVGNLRQGETPGSLVAGALDEGADAVIGGVYDVQYCRERGVPAMLHASTDDSIHEAVMSAAFVRRVMEQRRALESQNAALMDGAFNGFIMFDNTEHVQRWNSAAETLLGLSAKKLQNAHISELFPGLDMERYREAVETNTVLSDFMTVKRRSFATIIKPLSAGKERGGVVFSFRRTSKDLSGWNSAQNTSRTSFSITTVSPAMKKCVQTAKSFCMSERPVLIIGEMGTDTSRLARSIHSNSDCSKNGPFISADCACWADGDQQADYLFGYSSRASGDNASGMIGLAQNGSLFLDRIETLRPNVQHRLWQLLCNKRFVYMDAAPASINFRLIARSTIPLSSLRSSGKIIPELYQMLAPMSFTVPPVRETTEDLPRVIENTFSRLCNDFHRFLILSPEAMSQLCSYSWEGNLTQLHLFLERLVISCEEQVISRALVKTLMRDIYAGTDTASASAPVQPNYSPEELRVISALRKCHGDRDETARELGISKTTLWRWMKKYDITTKY